MDDVFSEGEGGLLRERFGGEHSGAALVLRALLHGLGYRFTVNGRRNLELPGRPDLVFPKWGTVVFVRDCFGHWHEVCVDFGVTGTGVEEARERDVEVEGELRDLGWNVVVVWGCELKDGVDSGALGRRLGVLIEGRVFEDGLGDGVCYLERVAEVEGWG